MTTDGFAMFILFIYLIGGILGIILFFKVWGMTNDVSRICKILENNFRISSSDSTNRDSTLCNKFNIGDKVVILSTGKVVSIIGCENGRYECATNEGKTYEGVFSENELNKF